MYSSEKSKNPILVEHYYSLCMYKGVKWSSVVSQLMFTLSKVN